MQLFGYRITGVSLKFFILLGLVVVVLVAFISFKPKPTPPPNLNYQAYFPTAQVSARTSKPGWIGAYEGAGGLSQPVSSAQFTSANFAPNVGLPMRLQIYVPDPSRFAAYTVNDVQGKNFIPALFISPTTPTSLTDLENLANPASPDFIVVGFPKEDVPIPGHAYSIKGLLWWRSDLLVIGQTGRPTTQTAPSPVFLADGYEELQPAQLRAPATHSVDLDLRYAESGQELTIQRVEWAAGREVRMLVTLRNLTNVTIPLWEGIGSSTASLPEQASVPGQPDLESAFAQATDLEPQQTITGYVVFDKSVSNPHEELTIRMPSLSHGQSQTAGGSENDIIILRIPTDRVVSQS